MLQHFKNVVAVVLPSAVLEVFARRRPTVASVRNIFKFIISFSQ